MNSSEEFTLPAKNEGLTSADSLTSIHAKEMTHTNVLDKAVPEVNKSFKRNSVIKG